MGKFEDSWKGVFDDAESTPSDSVWSNIDQAMEGGELKKRLIFYQRLAAAAVLFAFVLGGYEVYHLKTDDRIADQHFKNDLKKEQISQHKESLATNSKMESANQENNAGHNKMANSERGASNERKVSNNGMASDESKMNNESGIKSKRGLKSESVVKNTEDEISTFEKLPKDSQQENQFSLLTEKKNESEPVANENNSQNQIYFDHNREYSIADNTQELPLLPGAELKGGPYMVVWVRKLPAIPAAFMADNKKKNSTQENLWAALTASTGSYNANVPNSAFATNNASVGTSYSMSMLAGKRVAKRWALQSGVQYLNQSVTGTSYSSSGSSLAVVAANVYNLQYHPTGSGTTPVNLVSASEFVSVPVQIGYLIIDRKVGWQINPGLSTDFFIRNTLSDQSGQLQSYSQSAGDASPYRAVNFSGLVTSELSYKVSTHYRISLVPGLRYSFNPVVKPTVSSGSAGNPMLWDVGFRFKYIFK